MHCSNQQKMADATDANRACMHEVHVLITLISLVELLQARHADALALGSSVVGNVVVFVQEESYSH
jgi:hypothetical protein